MALRRGAGTTIHTLADLMKRTKRTTRGCRVWQGHVLPASGYALTTVGGVRMSFHHAAFFLKHGRRAKYLRHTCDVKACGNPDHLVEGTPKQNVRDAMERGQKGLLSFPKARAIREAYKNGATQVDLAKRFGVARWTVRSVLKGRSWQEEVCHR